MLPCLTWQEEFLTELLKWTSKDLATWALRFSRNCNRAMNVRYSYEAHWLEILKQQPLQRYGFSISSCFIELSLGSGVAVKRLKTLKCWETTNLALNSRRILPSSNVMWSFRYGICTWASFALQNLRKQWFSISSSWRKPSTSCALLLLLAQHGARKTCYNVWTRKM